MLKNQVETIVECVNNLTRRYKDVSAELSSCDAEIGSLQHILEIDKLNAIQISKTVKLLREQLALRRELKEEKSILQGIIDKTENFSSISKVYADLVKRSEARLADYDKQAHAALSKI